MSEVQAETGELQVCRRSQENSLLKSSLRSSVKKARKRIGPYTYGLDDVIGKGFSSTVYKGIRDGDRYTPYAIKSVRTKSIELNRKLLIQSEIAILKQIDHPNLLKIYDVFNTANHCYIITEFCEGGNLEKTLDNNWLSDWSGLITQIGEASKYLAHNCIIHRDLKPANIFLKGNIWKIGDFGFARILPQKNAVLIENYTIGSPLYMPLETLESNIYSSKTDSFAMGVIIHYVLTKKHPWESQHKNDLIRTYKTRKFDGRHIMHLSKEAKGTLKKMLSVDVVERPYLKDIDFSIWTLKGSSGEIEQTIVSFCNDYSEQALLCQYIHYLMMNASLFLEQINDLFTMMSMNLSHLVTLFQWGDKQCFSTLMSKFVLPNLEAPITRLFYQQLRRTVCNYIAKLRNSTERVHQSGMEKLLHYYLLVTALAEGDREGFRKGIQAISLHKDFSYVLPNTASIEQLLKRTQIFL